MEENNQLGTVTGGTPETPVTQEMGNGVKTSPEGVDTPQKQWESGGRFFDPFLIKGLKYPVRNKSH